MTSHNADTDTTHSRDLPDLAHIQAKTPPTGETPDQLRDLLLTVIEDSIRLHPRSLQIKAGPSDLGSPCDRQIGYIVSKTPKINTGQVGWLPAIGTAMHDQLDEWFALHNQHLNAEAGYERWLMGACFTLPIAPIGGEDITGHGDMYDLATGTVIDWKIVGKSTLDKVKRKPDPKYRVQAHCYGKGWNARGLTTRHVAVMYLPRNSMNLRDAHYWSEPYDQAVADAAILRADSIHQAITVVGRETILPTLNTADNYCVGCSWYRSESTDLATGCPGAANIQQSATRARERAVEGLIPPTTRKAA